MTEKTHRTIAIVSTEYGNYLVSNFNVNLGEEITKSIYEKIKREEPIFAAEALAPHLSWNWVIFNPNKVITIRQTQ